jgi:hypothetical protein
MTRREVITNCLECDRGRVEVTSKWSASSPLCCVPMFMAIAASGGGRRGDAPDFICLSQNNRQPYRESSQALRVNAES